MEQKYFPQRAAGRFVSAVVRVLRQRRHASRGQRRAWSGHAHAHACSIASVSVIFILYSTYVAAELELSC